MKKIVIQGGSPLYGTTSINGSKNAALPILFATLLLTSPVTLCNVPNLQDCSTTFDLLRMLGCSVDSNKEEHTVRITPHIKGYEAPYNLVKTMRASILCLGPLLARVGKAHVALPGGCAIGSRPVALHLEALQKMGVHYTIEEGYIVAECDKLRGASIHFSFPTVGGTENILMAASMADGETVIHNAAREPEIVDLANFLIKAGAKIEGHGTSTIYVQGVETLQLDKYTIMPDRIEAGTFMVAGIITDGEITIEQCPLDTLDAVVEVLQYIGGSIEELDDGIVRVRRERPLTAVHIETLPYPDFPTDMQAQIMALLCIAQGRSTISETIFENRFMHVQELARMGANIEISGHKAIVRGVESLKGAPVMASDLRASASLVLAGLVAHGITEIDRIYHLDRGYEALETKLQALGAQIERVTVSE